MEGRGVCGRFLEKPPEKIPLRSYSLLPQDYERISVSLSYVLLALEVQQLNDLRYGLILRFCSMKLSDWQWAHDVVTQQYSGDARCFYTDSEFPDWELYRFKVWSIPWDPRI